VKKIKAMLLVLSHQKTGKPRLLHPVLKKTVEILKLSLLEPLNIWIFSKSNIKPAVLKSP